tara:strand:- start:6263 stop:6991 length:729 start_codon:yes stop_codon:yes gene_type:complete
MTQHTTSTQGGALVLHSGGQDSAVCLAWALQRFDKVETVGFDYGQRHEVEMTARVRVRQALRDAMPEVARRLGQDHRVDLSGYGAIAESALTADREIEWLDGSLPSTFVPGRNLVFFTVAAAIAWRRGLASLVGGMCETDYSGYPDCRRDTLDATETMLRLGLDMPVTIATPLMHLDKAATWAMAEEIGGPALVELIRTETHSCYRGDHIHLHDWGYGCGDCPACDLREKGWRKWADGNTAS